MIGQPLINPEPTPNPMHSNLARTTAVAAMEVDECFFDTKLE